MEPKIDAIIWDLDGTLIDSDLYVVMNFIHMYEKYKPGCYPRLRDLVYCSGPSLRESIRKLFPEFNEDELVEEFSNYSDEYQSKLLSLYPGEKQALQVMKEAGVKMVVFTNKQEKAARMCLEALGLDEYISDVISSDNFKKVKPDPEGVFRCLDILKTEPSRTVMIGDSGGDLESGRRGGVKTGLVKWSLKKTPTEIRDYEFDSFDEIKELVINGKRSSE